MRSFILFSLCSSAAACGTNICDRVASTSKTYVAAAQACLASGETLTVATNAAACKQNESICSQADLDTYNAFLDCVAKIKAPTCTAGATTNRAALDTYEDAKAACVSSGNLNSLSTPCANAIAAAANINETSSSR